MRAIFILALCLHAAVSHSWINSGRYQGDVILTPYQERMLLNSTWINSGKYQGDVILTPHQERMLLNSTAAERNAIVNLSQKWPNNKVPYVYRDGVFSNSEKAVIQAAMDEYTQNTCIELVERTTEDYYIEFIKDGGCYSYWGRVSQRFQPQPISLANGCIWNDIIIHELMHAIGFLHEQSRSDRDDYVTIQWENIRNGLESQFRKQDEEDNDLLGLSYDYKSVMHYGATAFSKNGQPTIVAKDGSTDFGNRNGFSTLDLQKVNKLYQCNEEPTTEPTEEPTTTEEPVTEGPGNCEDTFDRLCRNWAGKNKCEQRGTMMFMHENCQKSCGTCETGGCYDTYMQCKGFARTNGKNWCAHEVYGEWMTSFCPYSCGLCSTK